MGSDFLKRVGRRAPGFIGAPGFGRQTPQAGHAPHSSAAQVSDKVSLSAAYRVIKKLETGVRIETLRLHVSRRTYWIPAPRVSRSIIAESLAV